MSLRIMKFRTFLLLLLVLFIIDNVSAKGISIKFPKIKFGSSRGTTFSRSGHKSSTSSHRSSTSSHSSSTSSHSSPTSNHRLPTSNHGSSINNHGSPTTNNHGSPTTNNHGSPTTNNHGSPTTNNHGSPTTNNHGSYGAGYGLSTGRTTQQQTKNINQDFLNAEGGGAKKPTPNLHTPSAPPAPVNTDHSSDSAHSLWRSRAFDNKGSVTPSPTSNGWSNPHFSTIAPVPIYPPWRPQQGNVAPGVTPPPIGFKQNVLQQSSSYPNSYPSSMPMGNSHGLHPPGTVHGSPGQTYYPQQPYMFTQPATQPFVPSQTVIMSTGQDYGIGQMVKEAAVHSFVAEVMRRVINPYPHHVESRPDNGSPSVTHITYNNYINNRPSGTSSTSSAINPTIGNAALPTQSNVSTSNQGNSTINPTAANNAMFYRFSDAELFTITETLFARSLDISKYIKLNLQQRTSPNVTGRATQRLLKIEPELLEYPTIYVTRALYDRYEHHFQRKLNRTKDLREQENLLLDTYLNTDVMASAMQWLADRGFIDPDDFERRDVLRRIWFTVFGGSTCGFERIFDSENYGVSIMGVQDWLHFAVKESTNSIKYIGWVDKLNLGNTASLLTLNFEMDGLVQTNRTIFVGTMPELEMSLYTICFYARPNDVCPVSLGGTKFVIFTHSFTHFGKEVMDLAFPVF
ncbi:uncharacterized protein LOC143175148 [Nomia melanderi]|uniref:uncharacterized protein LOC143175148 n=1 Tax=Nomia melanderi TaxID=2448451 RepID=UPI003FCD543B